jgi:predicted RNA-binding Zn ribbon-like protein
VSRADPNQIPNQLDRVIDYVNTLDLESGEDALQTPKALGAWLAERGLLPKPVRVTAGEHGDAIRLREALREAMLANNEGAPSAAGWSEIERAARSGELGVHFGPAGDVALAPRAGGVPGALSGLLAPVATALADGSWARVKACRAPDCGWAFYDRSRNRSATWCEMAVCGNRTKVRTYRRRTTAASE